MKNEKLRVPKLRFREFSGEWEEKQIKDILIDYRLGGNYSNTENINKYPLIKMGNLDRGKIVLNKIEYIDEKEEVNQLDKIKYGDLFFNTRNTLELVGKVAIWRNELPIAYYNSNLMWMKYEDNFFMNYRFNTYQGIKSLRSIATGTTSVAAIYSKDLFKIKLIIPQKQEQEKIASFLSSIDKKINQLSKKDELLQNYKKAMMQKIFSQKLRFKKEDGSDYPKWVKNKSSIKIISGNTYSLSSYSNKGTLLVQGLNIYPNELVLDKPIYIRDNATQISHVIVNKNDILVGLNRPIVNKKFKICLFNQEQAYLYQRAGVLDFDKLSINYLFLYYYLSSNVFIKQLNLELVGSDQPYIKSDLFKKTKNIFPSSLEEQTKIANFLSSLDTKISQNRKALEETQKFKKALLQKMFV